MRYVVLLLDIKREPPSLDAIGSPLGPPLLSDLLAAGMGLKPADLW